LEYASGWSKDGKKKWNRFHFWKPEKADFSRIENDKSKIDDEKRGIANCTKTQDDLCYNSQKNGDTWPVT